MSKPNFSKVEKALDEGIIRMKSQNLLKEADALKTSSDSPPKLPPKEVCQSVLTHLERDLRKLKKEDEESYKTFELKTIDLKKMISNPSLLTPQNWKEIKEIKERLEQYKKELAAQLPAKTDEERIEYERTTHLNKRHSLGSKKWIPLDRINP